MKQPGVILTLFVFIVAVSFVLSAQQRQNSRPLTAVLSGNAAGSGTATLLLNAAQSQVCYNVTVNGIATPAHVSLSNSNVRILSFGIGDQCAVVDRDRLMDIARNPSAYFVTVQNSDSPNIALRGQLTR